MLLKRYACDIARNCNKKSIKYLIKIGISFNNNETMTYYDNYYNHEYNFIAELINNLSGYNNNIKCIKYLHNKLNLFIGYDTCFRDALYYGHHRVLKYLFKHGSTLDEFDSLIDSIYNGFLETNENNMYKVIKFLIKNGLTQNNKDLTLECAIYARKYKIIHLLIKNDAKIKNYNNVSVEKNTTVEEDITIEKYNNTIIKYIKLYQIKSYNLIKQCINNNIILLHDKEIKKLLLEICDKEYKNKLTECIQIKKFIK
jgi:hypothetical protein